MKNTFLVFGEVKYDYCMPKNKVFVVDRSDVVIDEPWVVTPTVLDMDDGAAIAAYFRSHPASWDVSEVGRRVRFFGDAFLVSKVKLRKVSERCSYLVDGPSGSHTVWRDTYDFDGLILTVEYRNFSDTRSP